MANISKLIAVIVINQKNTLSVFTKTHRPNFIFKDKFLTLQRNEILCVHIQHLYFGTFLSAM